MTPSANAATRTAIALAERWAAANNGHANHTWTEEELVAACPHCGSRAWQKQPYSRAVCLSCERTATWEEWVATGRKLDEDKEWQRRQLAEMSADAEWYADRAEQAEMAAGR